MGRLGFLLEGPAESNSGHAPGLNPLHQVEAITRLAGLETEGIMNVLPKFSWPGSIWLQLESVTRASLEH